MKRKIKKNAWYVMIFVIAIVIIGLAYAQGTSRHELSKIRVSDLSDTNWCVFTMQNVAGQFLGCPEGFTELTDTRYAFISGYNSYYYHVDANNLNKHALDSHSFGEHTPPDQSFTTYQSTSTVYRGADSHSSRDSYLSTHTHDVTLKFGAGTCGVSTEEIQYPSVQIRICCKT